MSWEAKIDAGDSDILKAMLISSQQECFSGTPDARCIRLSRPRVLLFVGEADKSWVEEAGFSIWIGPWSMSAEESREPDSYWPFIS